MQDCDLLVVGGGITGLGIARLAARNGISTVVLERSDFASGTSSSSSHMLHGGLRYLEHGRFGLVRESLEQRAEVAAMAPLLARPARFMVPVYRGDRIGTWRLRIGLGVYDALAGPAGMARHRVVGARAALALEPARESGGLRGAGIYGDVVMDDARLAIAVGRDAAAHGARLHSYTAVTGARPAGDGRTEVVAVDRADGGATLRFRTRVLVNAAGPWVDEVRTLLARSLAPGSPDPDPLLRPSRGIHLVYPTLTRGHGLLLTARSDGRVCFAIPFAGMSLVGTTEVEVPSPPASPDWRPSLEEIRYLREMLARALPGAEPLPPHALISGLRPLLGSGEDVGRASREHAVVEEGGALTVAGGKYTTFRVIARDAVARVVERLKREDRRLRDPADPLPPPLAEGATVEQLARHAVEHEFARRVADVVRRRSTLWLAPDRGRAAASRIGAEMSRLLGWSPERTREEFQSWDASLWDEETLLRQASLA